MEPVVLFFVVATLISGATTEIGPFDTEEKCVIIAMSPLIAHMGARVSRVECVKRIHL